MTDLEESDLPRSRKERRRARRGGKRNPNNNNNQPQPTKVNLVLKTVNPLTKNQDIAFKAYREKHLLLHGYAGTGKSFLALYFALNDVLNNQLYDKVIIIKSAVQSRNQGHMPGNQEQKQAVFEAPYHSICSDLFGRGDAYDVLKQKRIVEFTTTSFLRGETLNNAVVILEEVQNMNDTEINTCVTRLGENSKLIINGDFRQNDLANRRNEESGIGKLLEVVDYMGCFTKIEMQIEDIVRSKLVKDWIVARSRIGLV